MTMSYQNLDPNYYPLSNPYATGQLPVLGNDPGPNQPLYNTTGVPQTLNAAGTSVITSIENTVDSITSGFGQFAALAKFAIYAGAGIYALSLIVRLSESDKGR